MKFNISILKSLAGSTVFKIGSSIIALLTVPLLLDILGKSNYGIWVTLTALIAWINLFDFGSGYSLKNKVTESIAKDEKSDLFYLIAGTLQFYILATALILAIFISSIFFIEAFLDNIKLSLILYIPIILTFPFSLGNFLIQGIKKFNLFNFLLLLQSVLWLIILVLNKYHILMLEFELIAIIYTSLYVLIRFFIFYFSLRYLEFDWKEILNLNHFIKSKKILLTGGKFFLLQLSSLALFSLGNLLTYSNLSAEAVAKFDTINKIFLLGMTFFNLVVSIYWAEISHTKALRDQKGLLSIRKQLFVVSTIFTFGAIIVSIITPLIIPIWTKGVILVSMYELPPFLLLLVIQFYSFSGAVFLNAFENLKGQVILSVLASILIIPLANLFFHLNIGIGSVPLASSVLLIPSLIYVVYESNNCIKSV